MRQSLRYNSCRHSSVAACSPLSLFPPTLRRSILPLPTSQPRRFLLGIVSRVWLPVSASTRKTILSLSIVLPTKDYGLNRGKMEHIIGIAVVPVEVVEARQWSSVGTAWRAQNLSMRQCRLRTAVLTDGFVSRWSTPPMSPLLYYDTLSDALILR